MTASGRSTNSSRTFPTAVTEETISRDLLTSSDVITSSDADLSTPFVVLLDARFTGGTGRQGQSSGSACLQSFPLSLRDWAAHASIMTPHAGRQPSRHDRRKFTLAPTAEPDSRTQCSGANLTRPCLCQITGLPASQFPSLQPVL